MYTNSLCYLKVATIVETLDGLRMRVWSRSEGKIIHQFYTSQVIATPFINDDIKNMLFHDSLGVEQVMSQVLLSPTHLHTHNSLSNQACILISIFSTHVLDIFIKFIIFLFLSSNEGPCLLFIVASRVIFTILSYNHNPFHWAISLYITTAKTMMTFYVLCLP